MHDIIESAHGISHALYLDKYGNVYVSGDNSQHQLGLDDTNIVTSPIQNTKLKHISQISCCYNNSACLTDSGEVHIFGDYYAGKHLPFTHNIYESPHKLENLPPIKQIVCGPGYIICLTVDGQVYAFGNNAHEEIGPAGIKYMYTAYPEFSPIIPITAIVRKINCGRGLAMFIVDN